MAGFSLGHTTLLLFQLGLTTNKIITPAGTLPGHGPSQQVLSQLLSGSGDDAEVLKQHYCLAAESRVDVEKWEEHFKAKEVKILGTMDWERGGRSVYFADPEGHVGEIASRGIWPHY